MTPRTVTLGGTAGGVAPPLSPSPSGQGGRRRIRMQLGGEHSDVFYLWLLLGLEVCASWALRHWSRNHHGG